MKSIAAILLFPPPLRRAQPARLREPAGGPQTPPSKTTPGTSQPTPATPAVNQPAVRPPSLDTRPLRWRSIGPANMGGRIADFAVVEKDPYTIYAGVGTGGVLKTPNTGPTWQGIFDKEPVASVGAVAVSQNNPKIVWAGTGEGNSRNSSSWGNGVYKSADGGETWTNMGLRDTQDVPKISLDPKNDDVVYVAALGHLWGASRERGIFKTIDGGKTWQHVLAV